MVRIIGFLVGLAFAGVLLISLFVGVSEYYSSPPAKTAEEEFHKEPMALHLASDGPFGRFDKQQLQRGFQVYKEVCSACHSLTHVAFYDLHQLGYSEAEITPFNIALGQFAAAYYFLHFLVIIPLVSKSEQPLPLPRSITDSVLHGEKQESAPAGVKTSGKTTKVAG